MAHFDIYIGGKRYATAKCGNATFEIARQDETDIDALINETIENLSFIRIEDDGYGNLEIEFQPITDGKILTAIENKDAYIRVQLMQYQPSGGVRRSIDQNPSCKHPYWDDDDYAYVRPRSHDSRYEGITWINLTANELSNGYCQLTDYQDVFVPNDAMDDFVKELGDGRYYWARVEMFCLALHRPRKDPFYYERNGERKISNKIEYRLFE